MKEKKKRKSSINNVNICKWYGDNYKYKAMSNRATMIKISNIYTGNVRQ
jgi:hypothetical protein